MSTAEPANTSVPALQNAASAPSPGPGALQLAAADGLRYMQYEVAKEHIYLRPIRALISKDLSEPYSIYVYRYFLNQWPDLCFMALDAETSALLGVIICKLEQHRSGTYRGYIAMLATASTHRGRGIGSSLVRLAIAHMDARQADEVVLETEVSNRASLRLYERLGFLRSKTLHRYYLNGSTAFRLALYLREGAGSRLPVGQGGVPVVLAGEEEDAPVGPGYVRERTSVAAGVV